MASGARIFELLDIKPEMNDRPDAATLPIIRGEVVFEDVCFGYTPDEQVLHNVNLTIQAGQNVAAGGADRRRQDESGCTDAPLL